MVHLNVIARCLLLTGPLSILGCGTQRGEPLVPAENSDFEKIQGTWNYVSHMGNGHPSSDDVGCYQKFVGYKTGRTWNKVDTPNSIVNLFWRFELNPEASPKQIDILMVGGWRLQGIYALEGDRLTLCYALEGSQGRPKQLKTTPGDMNVLYVLARVND